MKKLIPLILFIVIAVFLYFSLNSDSSKLPSPLLGKMFPNIEAKDFYSNDSVLLADLFSENMSLVNVWASWCVTCRQEHQMMMKIANNTDNSFASDYFSRSNFFTASIFDRVFFRI